jgi:hypothetical protein
MLHEDYDHKSSVAKKKQNKVSALEPHGASCQDELIGDKQPVIK